LCISRMNISPRSRRTRTPKTDAAKDARRALVGWKLIEARTAAVSACDQFASRLEVRGGRLSKNDSRCWSLLIDTVREIDKGIDMLRPRLTDEAFRSFARTRSKPKPPPRTRQPIATAAFDIDDDIDGWN
jgi:hypothetical protein